MFLQSVKMAWESIRSNKMRSILTMLGIIIGVFSLVVLVSLVSSATHSISNEVSGLGSSSLQVQIMDDKDNPLSLEELLEFEGQGDIGLVAPLTTRTMGVKYGSKSENSAVYGSTPEYQKVQDVTLSCGRFLKESDQYNHTSVAVVSKDVVTSIMKMQNVEEALGKELHINGQNFTVVGVMAKKDSTSSLFSQADYTVVVPYTTLTRMSGVSREILSFAVSAKDGDLSSAQKTTGDLLMKRLEQDKKAFYILNFNSVMDALNSVMATMSLVLGGVAGISLLVGGIGIMNIMLVSVTERTKEIGIRKAIGADRRVIMQQFLIEALMISLIGCGIGVGISWGALRVAGIFFKTFPIRLSPGVVVLSIAFSMGIGLIFGIYPANKAAKKKPIDALRYNG